MALMQVGFHLSRKTKADSETSETLQMFLHKAFYITFPSGFYLVSPKVSLVCLTDVWVLQADDGLLHVHLNLPEMMLLML